MRARGATVLLVVVAVLLLLSGILLLAGGYHDHNLNRPISGGGTATGTVTSVRKELGASGLEYLPVITYVVGGHDYILLGSPSPRTGLGMGVRISYDRSDPGRARDISQPAPPAVRLFVQGAIFVLMGAFLGLISLRRLRGYLVEDPEG